MRRIWMPVAVGAAIAAGVFALARAQIFEPSSASADNTATGDAGRGALVFEQECAGCHGTAGEGGSGPRLVETGLEAAFVTERVREGAGIMPPGLVTGQDEADVIAYVVSISSP